MIHRLPRVLFVFAVLLIIAAGARSVPHFFERLNAADPSLLPSTRVRTGHVTFSVTADGALQGGNSRMLRLRWREEAL